MQIRDTSGFTIIEILIVVFVLVVLVVLGLNTASEFGKTETVTSAAQTIASSFDEARARTLASENRSQYGVYVAVGSSSAVLFRGNTYIPTDANNEIFMFDPRVQIATTTRGTTTSVVFTRLSGTSTPITITVSHVKDASTTASVIVQTTGLVNIQ